MKLPGTGGPPSVHLIPRWRSSPVYGQASPTAQGVETGLFGKISRFPSRPQRFPSANRGVVARKMPENRRFCNYSPPSESKRDSDLIRTIRHQITRRGRYSTRYHDMHGYYNRVGIKFRLIFSKYCYITSLFSPIHAKRSHIITMEPNKLRPRERQGHAV